MSPYDLTTLAAAKAWLGLPATASPNDTPLSALVTAASRTVYACLSRASVLPKSYDETFDGEGQRIFLRNWPVLSVTSVTYEGAPLPAIIPSVGFAYGYALKPEDPTPPGRQQAVDLFGCAPARSRQAVSIAYVAGYAVQGEAQSVPSAAPYALQALAPYGPWAQDTAVVYAATGLALTCVAATPALGQYAVANGAYTFSAADAGAPLQISYGFVPQDMAQACLELVGERFRAAEHIGQRSKSIGGQETVSFDPAAISAPVIAMLQPYRRVSI